MPKKIIAVNGSYRRGGVISQAVDAALAAARAAGAATETVSLVDAKIEFCTNCRACTQAPGEKRGACPLNDDMNALLDRLEAADGLILAAPVNCFNVTAVMRRFMERLVVYGYWPWDMGAPEYRLKKNAKKAVLITSAAMPSVLGRIFTGAMRALKYAARTLGADVAGTMFVGIACMKPDTALTEAEKKRAGALGRLLAA